MNYQGNVLHSPLTVTQLVSLHYFSFGKNYDFSGESHDFWELVFVDSGEITVTDGNNTHILMQGQIFLHHPGVFHNITANNRYSNVAVVGFKCDCPALLDAPACPAPHPPGASTIMRGTVFQISSRFPMEASRVGTLSAIRAENPVRIAPTASERPTTRRGMRRFRSARRCLADAARRRPPAVANATKPPREKVWTKA